MLSKIDKLPSDIWLQIFEYGIIQEALQVYDLSDEFEKACCLYTKHQILSLRNKTFQGVNVLQERLKDFSVLDDYQRLSITKSIMFLRYLITELNILVCTVLRYSSNQKAWIIISPYLVPVIDEFESVSNNAMALELQRDELTNFNVRLLLGKYYEFLSKFDSQIEDMLEEVMNITPFEIKAIDILSCCPTINSQLSVMREIDKSKNYNISSFYRIHNLKPIFQVPDVHNAHLSTQHKKSKLIAYLRDCVQWENATFLQSIINEITDLELRLNIHFMDEFVRFQLIGNLSKKYENIHNSPYTPVFQSVFITKLDDRTFLNEHYSKQTTLNQNMTGLSVTMTIPNQPPQYLPIVVHSFRGKLKPFVDEAIINIVDENFNLYKLKDNFYNVSKDKRAFQLCISFREGLNSSSAEAIIDVSYDQNSESHVSINIVRAEPFETVKLISQNG